MTLVQLWSLLLIKCIVLDLLLDLALDLLLYIRFIIYYYLLDLLTIRVASWEDRTSAL